MSRLTSAPDGPYLLLDGVPHFPLADTVWNVFAEATKEEWRGYLRHRRQQGFSALLVSTLPILHDRSINPAAKAPYALRSDGTYDFARPDAGYRLNAREMAEEASREGFTLFLVVLWTTYVPGTRANDIVPWAAMPEQARAEHARWVCDTFADLDPVFVISGDDPFSSEGAVEAYRALLTFFSREAPQCLRTMHGTPDSVLPPAIIDDPSLDLILLQTGHQRDDGRYALELIARETTRTRRRPVINAEYCYEGHRHTGSIYRFDRHEMRRVAWTSVLAGASAGLGYGAHGVWQWHRPGLDFTGVSFSGMPFPWEVALRFHGAGDVSFIRRLVEDHGLNRFVPSLTDVIGAPQGVRFARDRGSEAAALYIEAAQEVRLNRPLTGRIEAWDLASRWPIAVRVRSTGASCVIEQPNVNGDVLVLASGD